MRKILTDKKELRRLALETAAVIGICALVFAGVTQAAFSAATNQTATVPAAYSTPASNASSNSGIPAGYVKVDYKLQLGPYSSQPAVESISEEEAAERGARDLWRVFNLDLSGKTIEMTYNKVTSTQPRADWAGIVTIDKNLSYFFSIDAITGEVRGTHKDKYWNEGVNTGMDVSLLQNHSKYDALARTITEKYQFVSGKVTSTECAGQGFCTNPAGAQNSDVNIRVTSENGQQAQLEFSRYNQEFLGVDYDCWVKEITLMEEQAQKDQQNRKTPHIVIDDQKMDGAQEKSGFWIKLTHEGG
jgi:hypothetical protein